MGLGFELATVRGQHVVHALRLAPICECDNKLIAPAKNEHRRAVLPMGFPSDVDDHSHARQASCQWTKKTISHMQIKSCEPPRCRHRISQAFLRRETTPCSAKLFSSAPLGPLSKGISYYWMVSIGRRGRRNLNPFWKFDWTWRSILLG